MRMFKSLGMLFAFVLLSTGFNWSPAAAYEDCHVGSYGHCMSCGAKYGHTGSVQENFCADLRGSSKTNGDAGFSAKPERRISCMAWCSKCKNDDVCHQSCSASGNRSVNASCNVRGNG
jgi:hypothetical protein